MHIITPCIQHRLAPFKPSLYSNALILLYCPTSGGNPTNCAVLTNERGNSKVWRWYETCTGDNKQQINSFRPNVWSSNNPTSYNNWLLKLIFLSLIISICFNITALKSNQTKQPVAILRGLIAGFSTSKIETLFPEQSFWYHRCIK